MNIRTILGAGLAILTLAAAAQAGEPAAAAATAAWPEFRGPWGNGWAAMPGDAKPVGLPLKWSETENVRWKTAIPFRGWSTPVILGNQVWLTTAAETGTDFYALCVDAETGRILINEKIFHADAPEVLGNATNGYASPSPAIEPGRLYVHFGSYGTACLDTATGKPLWERRDLPCRHFRGPGSSVILWQDLLILSMDGVDVQYLTALDKMTGRTVWKTDRTADWNDLDADGKPKSEGDLRKGFCTPLVIDVAGAKQMISLGAKAAYGYDPRTGKELWKIGHKVHSPASRPVAGGGLVFFSTGYGGATEMWAARPDGRGDVTGTHVVWKYERDAPKTASPLLVGDLLYMVSDTGAATCLEAATGAVVWRDRAGGDYAASPIYADGRIYFFSRQGRSVVLKPGRTFEVLAANKLEEGMMASPAVAGKALFLRTKGHLYRIETP